MVSKRPANVNVVSESKVSHKSITLEQKMKVIRRFNSGDRAVDIACDMALAPTTERRIFKVADKIRAGGQNVTH